MGSSGGNFTNAGEDGDVRCGTGDDKDFKDLEGVETALGRGLFATRLRGLPLADNLGRERHFGPSSVETKD